VTARTYIQRLARVGDVLEVDTFHDVMISQPAALGAILAERCRPTRAASAPTHR
jgi:hypothetical protein